MYTLIDTCSRIAAGCNLLFIRFNRWLNICSLLKYDPYTIYIYFYAYMFTVSWINTNLFAFGFVHCERKKLNLNTINMHRHHANTRTDIQLQNAVTLYSNKINIRLENTVEWKNTHTHTKLSLEFESTFNAIWTFVWWRISSRVEVWKCIKQNSCINAKY